MGIVQMVKRMCTFGRFFNVHMGNLSSPWSLQCDIIRILLNELKIMIESQLFSCSVTRENCNPKYEFVFIIESKIPN